MDIVSVRSAQTTFTTQQDIVASHACSVTDVTNLARANVILHELKDAGYSNKDLNELELIVLMDMAANEHIAKNHVTCDN